MDNANSPAMPITNEAMASAFMENKPAAFMLGGLTKREQIAAMAMQGILSNAYWNEHGAYRPKDVSEAAVEYADELLSALSAGKESNNE